jgi:hypothetical protein
MTETSKRHVDFPVCGDWSCDDEEDWDVAAPGDPEYPGAKREEQLARYHQPRSEWRERLQAERDRRSGGRPLWMRRV